MNPLQILTHKERTLSVQLLIQQDEKIRFICSDLYFGEKKEFQKKNISLKAKMISESFECPHTHKTTT